MFCRFVFNSERSKQNCSRRHYIFYVYILKKIRHDVSCESSARQSIHMKYQVLFSLENNEKIFKTSSAAVVVIGALFSGPLRSSQIEIRVPLKPGNMGSVTTLYFCI